MNPYSPLQSNRPMLAKLDELLPSLESALEDIRYYKRMFEDTLDTWPRRSIDAKANECQT